MSLFTARNISRHFRAGLVFTTRLKSVICSCLVISVVNPDKVAVDREKESQTSKQLGVLYNCFFPPEKQLWGHWVCFSGSVDHCQYSMWGWTDTQSLQTVQTDADSQGFNRSVCMCVISVFLITSSLRKHIYCTILCNLVTYWYNTDPAEFLQSEFPLCRN